MDAITQSLQKVKFQHFSPAKGAVLHETLNVFVVNRILIGQHTNCKIHCLSIHITI